MNRGTGVRRAGITMEEVMRYKDVRITPKILKLGIKPGKNNVRCSEEQLLTRSIVEL